MEKHVTCLFINVRPQLVATDKLIAMEILECYNVDEVPEGEWYCQRCEALKMKKPVHILCCPMEDGAIRHTMIPGEFMHVVCAMWNKKIDDETEPYGVIRSQLDVDHLMEAENGPSRSTVPKKRKLLRNDIRDDTVDEEYEENEDDDDDGDEHNDIDEDNSTVAEQSRNKLLKQRKDKQQDVTKVPIKRRATAQHAKNTGPIRLFQSDQSDSEDDMGTSARKISQKSRSSVASDNGGTATEEMKSKLTKTEKGKVPKPFSSNPPLALDRHKPIINGTSTTAPPKQKLPNKTHLAVPTNATAATTARPLGMQSSILNTGIGPSNGAGSILGSGNSAANLTRSPTGLVKDYEENDYWSPAQRRNTLPHAPQTPTNDIPNTQTPSIASFDITTHVNSINRRNHQQMPLRKSMDSQNESINPQTLIALKAQFNEIFDQACFAGGKPMNQPTTGDQQTQLKLQSANMEASRLREELRRTQEQLRRATDFKKSVAEVFEALNVRIPSVTSVTLETVDTYVAEIKGMLVREGPIRASESARLADTVDKIMNEYSY
ncbi:hypothetical protein EC973_009284 [Apophysomyces ossiformis]|uniref:PHD-type domain-containing protein n=1 Tax=Apophysomyces ossiformis TaxID=679940 RepID=A0A8H7BYJ7_9FUNG|nr:hypothetical protein EC973_009284 [Apophysomyces ossiformis]